ncbi:unnamed protein product [Ascophyllum nodosum]
MASAAIARVGLCFLALSPSTLGQSKWQLVAPRAATLPSGEPPSSFARRDNIVSPVGVTDSLSGRPALLQTNKFYSNFVLDGPSRSAWTLPYIVTVNEEYPFGMYVSYPKYFAGQTESDGRIKWYATSSTKDIILSAKELQARKQVAKLTDFDDEGLSATVSITTKTSSKGSIETYLVRGMAYATAKYKNYTPEIASVHAILRVNGVSASSRSHTSSDGRFAVELNDGSTWMLYYSGDEELQLNFVSASDNGINALKGNVALTGTLRAALVPYDAASPEFEEAVELLDQYAGTYPTKGALRAWMHKTQNMARYKIIWYTEGEGSGLLHYALPHQQDLLDSSQKTGVYLSSPTKGEMELVTGRVWTMTERSLPDIEWVPTMSYITNNVQRDWIGYYLEQEIALSPQSIAGESVYFGAKHLMAYAQLCLVASELARYDLVEECVDKVEAGFDIYLKHENGNPLVYDEARKSGIWGGVIGSLGLEEGNGGADFYAAYYNDHHFHYSYLVNAAAVLAHLRPSWVTDEHKEWVETLIRDVSNPNKNDDYFPHFRSFDWFCGHSWARGLLFAYDGKDQESTSEDVNFSYAMTMWAMATGNTRLEGLGRLQTAVVTRSINAYFLLKDFNTNHPADFVRNKVTGIFFESKVDYTTWFGNNVEYIHGIQNIPVTAITESVRDPEFVSQEWDQRLESIASAAGGVWKTVLFMSYATVQKNLAFAEMLTSGVDDGLRRSWALYWAASRPDCTKYCEHREASPSTPTPVPSGGGGGGSSGSAYEGSAAAIPGTIEVERFDYGGEGIAYSDTDAGNNGGVFRTDESVDILKTGNGQGYNLGWLRAGEYLRYTVNVSKKVSKFNFTFLVAAPSGRSGELQVVAGGSGCSDYDTDLSGVVSVLSTGSWTNFEPLEVKGKGGLSSGENTLWLCVLSAGFNIDSVTMSEA